MVLTEVRPVMTNELGMKDVNTLPQKEANLK